MWSGLTGNGLDPMYRAALAAPHTVYTRVDVTDSAGNLLQSDLPFVAGSVTASLQQRVVRTLDLTVDRSWFPVTSAGAVDTTATLAPFGNRIKAYRGIDWGDGTLTYFPVFTGSLDTAELARDGSIKVTAKDFADDVVAAGFEVPTNSTVGVKLVPQFQILISGALTNATFGTSDQAASLMPALTWEYDRGKALDDVAAAAGMIWYQLPDGGFVMRAVPWTKAGLSAVATLTDVDVLLDWQIRVTRQGVNNAIVYVSERQGATPAYAIARDTVTTSPTRYRGPLGRRPRLIQNQVPLSQAQCLAAARTTLQSAKAITLSVASAGIVPDPALELGDVLQISADGVSSLQCVTGFTLPLREGSTMPLTLRAYAPLS
jgi:hypothetical protein